MGRRLKTDIHGPDWRRDVEDAIEKGVDSLFEPEISPSFPLIVEIGFGRGEFLAELANQRQDAGLLGVELSAKRVTKMARRLARGELHNVRLLEGRGQDVVGPALPAGRVAEFWINFPDPWPKKRHARRRLVQPDFVAALARKLAPGGVVQLATDHVPYAEQMHEVLALEPALVNEYAPAPWMPEVGDRKRTAYELEWRAEGRPLHFFAYRRRTP